MQMLASAMLPLPVSGGDCDGWLWWERITPTHNAQQHGEVTRECRRYVYGCG